MLWVVNDETTIYWGMTGKTCLTNLVKLVCPVPIHYLDKTQGLVCSIFKKGCGSSQLSLHIDLVPSTVTLYYFCTCHIVSFTSTYKYFKVLDM